MLYLILISCKKDKTQTTLTTPVSTEETPMPTFYQLGGFNTSITPTFFQPDFEVGYAFKPIEYGVLNAITIKLPYDFNRNRITLWDRATGTILSTWRIPISFDPTADKEYIMPLTTPLALTKNKEYILSININSWYLRQRGATDAPYPFTIGSIQIINYLESPTGPNQIMPTQIYSNYVAGDLGFKFQRLQ
jgi:hypothetical protein